MYFAKEIKKRSTTEYILYMWQVEDTIRAFDCSLPRLRMEYITRFDYTQEQREELADWYGNMIGMMNNEGCREAGHLSINNAVVAELEERHKALLKDPSKYAYKNQYYKVLPMIVELRARGANKEDGEIATFLTALYGVMMYRVTGRQLSPQTNNAVKEISKFLTMLDREKNKR